MALVNDRCICLRKVEFSETSQILTLFSRGRGVVKVIAKGAHRVNKNGSSKFDGGIDLMDLGEATFTDRVDQDLATLTEWKLIEGHRPLRYNLRGLYLGISAIEWAGIFFHERDPHPEAFDLLNIALLEFSKPTLEQAFVAYQMDLLKHAGFYPEIWRCVGCSADMKNMPGRVGFDSHHGGLLCNNCMGAYPHRMNLDGKLIGILRTFDRLLKEGWQKLPKLTRLQSDPINRMLGRYASEAADRELRLLEYIL
jgi:DNA repair protein RecO (recombination protein O)